MKQRKGENMTNYWFIDTRKNGSKPFAIKNPDVAKSWSSQFAMKEGPFKPVDDFKTEIEEEFTEEQKTEIEDVTDVKIDIQSVYDEMTVEELQDELKAREIEFKSKDVKAVLIRKLVEDDEKTGGE